MSDVQTPGASPVYHPCGIRTCFPHGDDVPERASAFVREHLAADPMRELAARAVAEIAADLVALDRYPAYQVSLHPAAATTTSCTFVGVPDDYAEETPELAELAPDHRWPGFGPGRLLALTGHTCDDGAWIEFPTPVACRGRAATGG